MKNFWICIIGSTDKEKLPKGADAPLRSAVEKAYKETVGSEDEVCLSGWGNDKERVDVLNTIWSMDKEDPVYKEVEKILLKNNRIIKE